jgi:hypothetical protein
MQRAINKTIEEEVFSMWIAYIHCWATDVSSTGPPRDYVNIAVVNEKCPVERERERSESSAVKEDGFG